MTIFWTVIMVFLFGCFVGPTLLHLWLGLPAGISVLIGALIGVPLGILFGRMNETGVSVHDVSKISAEATELPGSGKEQKIISNTVGVEKSRSPVDLSQLAEASVNAFHGHLGKIARVEPGTEGYSSSGYSALLTAMVMAYLGQKAFVEKYWGDVPKDRLHRWLPPNIAQRFYAGDIAFIESFSYKLQQRGKTEYDGGELCQQYRDLQRGIVENDDSLSTQGPFQKSTKEIKTETITDNENRTNALYRNKSSGVEATDVANTKKATRKCDRCGKPEGNDIYENELFEVTLQDATSGKTIDMNICPKCNFEIAQGKL
jgi:hypothetical protein